tara:strand:+ start:1256 stop:1570 length:315 start_codon:yes stop_codon:yes gene_type:complete
LNIEFDWKVILVVFWIPFIYLFIRDIIGIFKSKKGIKKYNQQVIDSEKRIIEKMKQLEKSRQEISQQMIDLDTFMTKNIEEKEEQKENKKDTSTKKENKPQTDD